MKYPEKPIDTYGNFTLWQLISHDLGQAWWNILKRYTSPFVNYDHWRSARGFLKSALVRPYWHVRIWLDQRRTRKEHERKVKNFWARRRADSAGASPDAP